MTTHQAAWSELDELRARLFEAEETLRAIRSGEVDALVVNGTSGEQVFALKSADQPYRIMLEQMREGALTVSSDGAILYCNRRFAEIVGLPLEHAVGRSLLELVEPSERHGLARSLREGADVRRELWMACGRPPLRVLLSLSPVELDHVDGLSGIVADLTEQRRSEEAAAAASFARAVVEQASEPMVVCDTEGRVLRASRAAIELAGGEPEGRALWDALPVRLAREAQSDAIRTLVRQALAGETRQGLEAISGDGAAQRHFQLSAGPLWNLRKQAIGCIVSLTDITHRKRAEERQNLLLAELSHRVKNTLAIVRAIAERTADGAADPAAFNAAFQGRLRALSLAHDVLTRVAWGEADLRQLLADSLSAATGRGVELAGPEVTLPAQAVQPLALIFHELATNAFKYGALASPAGRLGVRWRTLGSGALEIEWREQSVHPVAPPARKGFGSQLISRAASFDLDGEAELDFRPDGLLCLLRIPLRASEATLLREAVSLAGG